MYIALFTTLAFFFLAGTFFLTSIINAFRVIHRKGSLQTIHEVGKRFFYHPLHMRFFPKREFEGLFFSATCAQNVSRFSYAVCATILLLQFGLLTDSSTFLAKIGTFFAIVLFIILSFVIGDFLPRLIGVKYSKEAIKLFLPPSAFYMLIAFPITFIFLKLSRSLSQNLYFDHMHEPKWQIKEEIIDIIHHADTGEALEQQDKKLIESVVTFKDKIVREVMVPRIEIFSLKIGTSIKEAAEKMEWEGYSRVPVYKNSIDNIVGVLMYKDLMEAFIEFQKNNAKKQILDEPIDKLLKSVLYVPETTKLSYMLQEFRKKQTHLAIVVDEYGGTAGLITIEDILEEIVGEIEDEYDDDERLYRKLPEGGWVVDAKMTLLDVEDELGIKIPQKGDYDTISGFLYHEAGSIPKKGFIVYHDNFEMEVLSSDERSVEKVKIKPKNLVEETKDQN